MIPLWPDAAVIYLTASVTFGLVFPVWKLEKWPIFKILVKDILVHTIFAALLLPAIALIYLMGSVLWSAALGGALLTTTACAIVLYQGRDEVSSYLKKLTERSAHLSALIKQTFTAQSPNPFPKYYNAASMLASSTLLGAALGALHFMATSVSGQLAMLTFTVIAVSVLLGFVFLYGIYRDHLIQYAAPITSQYLQLIKQIGMKIEDKISGKLGIKSTFDFHEPDELAKQLTAKGLIVDPTHSDTLRADIERHERTMRSYWRYIQENQSALEATNDDQVGTTLSPTKPGGFEDIE